MMNQWNMQRIMNMSLEFLLLSVACGVCCVVLIFGQPFTQIPCEGMVVLTGTDRPFLAILDFPGSEWGVDQLLNIQPEDMYILGADIEKNYKLCREEIA
ncbi:hypothetical protein ACP0HM_19660 [Escherichia coli]